MAVMGGLRPPITAKEKFYCVTSIHINHPILN